MLPHSCMHPLLLLFAWKDMKSQPSFLFLWAVKYLLLKEKGVKNHDIVPQGSDDYST